MMKYLERYYDDHGPRFAVAPMMDWSDRHCRYFHRLMTKKSLLYTEMVVADAIVHGDRNYLLNFNVTEHPVALQLGGSDPEKLAEAAKAGMDFGYDEINLNVGCPSDRVQSGAFGACLMEQPDLVGKCVEAMERVVTIPITVKCRIGVDEQDPEIALDALSSRVWESGADAIWVHARKAWLQGLSPKQNRDIPPLDYGRVYQLKDENRSHFIGINGGIENLNQCAEHIQKVDGVMLGRAAYQTPSLLRFVDKKIFGSSEPIAAYDDIIEGMAAYAEEHVSRGGRLNQITRHMIGLFQGVPGARAWRQILSTEAVKPGAGSEVIYSAYSQVSGRVEDAA